jgi:succinyl-CoA synthetase alpha subunit
MLPDYQADPGTDAVVIIGELGGTMEEEVAEAMSSGSFTKPVVAFLGGRTAPAGKRMGHAGAIVTGGKGSVKDKIEAFEKAGAMVADRPRMVGELLALLFGEAGKE